MNTPPVRLLIPAFVVALTLVACGEKTIVPGEAAKSVAELVAEQTGFEATDVTCPEDVEAKVGGTFECTFTGPEGPYTAEMEITEVDGENVTFAIETRPTG